MIDPTLELHAAIVAALKGDSDVTAIVAQKVFDEVTEGAAMPYVTMGQPQVLPDRADCIDGAEVFFPVHCWAGGPQSVVIKELAHAVAASLDQLEPSLSESRVILFDHDGTQYLDDPDGQTKHAVVTFRILTEPVN